MYLLMDVLVEVMVMETEDLLAMPLVVRDEVVVVAFLKTMMSSI